MKNQIIVVEGYHDQIKVNSVFPDINCIITNGSEISDETLNLIYQASLNNEVILFLDPDYPGKKIMNVILDTGGNFKLAYIGKDKAISKNKKKVGIEHASKKDIYQALENTVHIHQNNNHIQFRDLLKRGLVSQENSNELRKKIAKELNIPFANGKTFLKYMNILNIKVERIDEILYGA
ncbi:ribonuclease M5 [Mycoplasmatota bacterium]|nr:ribonuclease M5 [Mycoplasmatota bacterium]